MLTFRFISKGISASLNVRGRFCSSFFRSFSAADGSFLERFRVQSTVRHRSTQVVITLVGNRIVTGLVRSPYTNRSYQATSSSYGLSSITVREGPTFLSPAIHVDHFGSVTFIISSYGTLTIRDFVADGFTEHEAGRSNGFQGRVYRDRSFGDVLIFFAVSRVIPLEGRVVVQTTTSYTPAKVGLANVAIEGSTVRATYYLFSTFFS